MKAKELMAGYTPNKDFEGWATNDDFVLAVGIELDSKTDYENYAVVQMGVSGMDANMNPTSDDKTYLRAGTSTMKTGNQRTFQVTGDRYIGDEFQDYACSHKIKYGTGSAVVVPYIYFNVLNGAGEQGSVSIITNSDGSGDAGASAEVDIELKKNGAAPTEFNWLTDVTAAG